MSDNLTLALSREIADETAHLDALHRSFVSRAVESRVVDATYRTVDSPVGALLLVATEEGLARVAFALEDHDAVLDSIAIRIGPRIVRSGRRLDEPARELDDYFARRRRTFGVPVDLRLAHGFRLDVLRHLCEIPYGRTETYSQVAIAAGSPRAVRAVGTACATNPLPIVVPCHRVLRSDGSLGGYLGGLDVKQRLLDLESARPPGPPRPRPLTPSTVGVQRSGTAACPRGCTTLGPGRSAPIDRPGSR